MALGLIHNILIQESQPCQEYAQYKTEYIFYNDGVVKVVLDGKVRENCMWLPRLGFEFKVPGSKKKFRYFGRGPSENYCDMMLHTTTFL